MRVVATSSTAAGREDWGREFFDPWYDVLAAGEAAGRSDPASWRREELRAEFDRGAPDGRADEEVHWLLALEGTEPFGSAEVRMTLLDNVHVAYLTIAVAPAHRRRGVGALLLRTGLDLAEAAGRSRVRTAVERPVEAGEDDWPGALAARRWGFTAGQREARRQLSLPVPASHLDALEAAARPFAGGYAVGAHAGPVPEVDLEAMAHLTSRMSTDAPMGELTVEPEVWDGARIREVEALRAAQGRRQWLAVARTVAGELVGYTMLVNSEHEPERLLQWDTLVLREHRGHRLGLLLKLACLRAAVADVPGVQRVTTWNAVSNTPMIAVNEALGFVWDEVVEEREAAIADVRAALSVPTR